MTNFARQSHGIERFRDDGQGAERQIFPDFFGLDFCVRQQDALLHTLAEGEFRARTIDDVQNLALLLGGMFQNAESAMAGLYELMLNGVEHGNLGIGFDLKAELLSSGGWEGEIERRLRLPENREKFVTLEVHREGRDIAIEISDQGAGFNWRPFMLIEPARATCSNGRGIAKANLLTSDFVNYRAPGNVVSVRAAAMELPGNHP